MPRVFLQLISIFINIKRKQHQHKNKFVFLLVKSHWRIEMYEIKPWQEPSNFYFLWYSWNCVWQTSIGCEILWSRTVFQPSPPSSLKYWNAPLPLTQFSLKSPTTSSSPQTPPTSASSSSNPGCHSHLWHQPLLTATHSSNHQNCLLPPKNHGQCLNYLCFRDTCCWL